MQVLITGMSFVPSPWNESLNVSWSQIQAWSCLLVRDA